MMANLDPILRTLVSLLIICSSTTANRKVVGSKDCVISQYCEDRNAINALEEAFGMSEEDATAYIAIATANDTTTRVHSCSCHDSCAYLGLCCQDKQVDIPEEYEQLADRLVSSDNAYMCEQTLGKSTVVINTCPSNSPAVMKKECVKDVDNELLVTSNSTSLTYKNIYCGLCNGEKLEKLMAWSWNFDCIENLPRPSPAADPSNIFALVASKNCNINSTYPQLPPLMLEVHHSIGVYLDSKDVCTSPSISSCPTGADRAHECENMAISLISYEGKIYKNQHCLRCNEGATAISSAICEACENENCAHREDLLHNPNTFITSFGILVQPYNDVRTVKCKTVDKQNCDDILNNLPTCKYGQYLDYQTSQCTNVCPETFILKDGICIYNNETCQEYLHIDNFTKVDPPSASNAVQLHEGTFTILGQSITPCYQCNYTRPVTAETDGFEIRTDGLVTFKSTPISSNLIYNIDNVTFYVCLDGVFNIEETERNLDAEHIITYLLLAISILSLILYFAAYITFKRLRNVPGKIVAGNMLCLFFAYVCFIMRNLPNLVGTPGCTVIGILINYFFLASFVFNIIYAAFIVHSLDSMESDTGTTNWTAFQLWIIGLVVPFTVIVPGIALDSVGQNIYRPQYGGEECFINGLYGQYIYFVGPIGLCLLVAILLYLTIIVKLVKLAKETRMVRSNHSEKISIAIKLLIVLGFNWIFAVIAAIDQGEITALIFIITCSLQGFFGFIVFICNKATLIDVKKCLNKHPNVNFEMSSSIRGTNTKHTLSSEVKKDILTQKDSSKVLLKTNDDAGSV